MKDACMRTMKMVSGTVSVFPKPDGCRDASTEGVSASLAAQPCIWLLPVHFYGLWSPRFERLEAALAALVITLSMDSKLWLTR